MKLKNELFSIQKLSPNFLEHAPKNIIEVLKRPYYENATENFFEAYILHYIKQDYLDFSVSYNKEAKLKLKDGEQAFIEYHEEDLIKKVRDGYSFLENELELSKRLLLTYYYLEYEIRLPVK